MIFQKSPKKVGQPLSFEIQRLHRFLKPKNMQKTPILGQKVGHGFYLFLQTAKIQYFQRFQRFLKMEVDRLFE